MVPISLLVILHSLKYAAPTGFLTQHSWYCARQPCTGKHSTSTHNDNSHSPFNRYLVTNYSNTEALSKTVWSVTHVVSWIVDVYSFQEHECSYFNTSLPGKTNALASSYKQIVTYVTK